MTDIKALLKDAEKKEASDVHICVGASPKYRIHGKLTDSGFMTTTSSDTLAMLLGIINEEQREIFEKTGEIDVSVSLDGGRYRVNAYKQRGVITIAVRIVKNRLPELNELSIPAALTGLTAKEKGLIIVSGPSGSGKSTVLAALLDKINSERACNIITLEDPIEYLHTHKLAIVNQREIGIDSDSYEEGLRSALREDPDVIFVSKINSAESVRLMLNAVDMGKLVFTASFMSSAKDVLDGIISLFSRDEENMIRNRLSAALESVVARKLINTEQGTRRAAYEVMLCDKNIREAIKNGKNEVLESLIHEGHSKGMFTMDESVLSLFVNGAISSGNAVNCANNTDRMILAVSAYSK
ncbi:MAG: PilT/PilU family type 4a pilus ATPase [Lachnospiraceae bacterium]|nr:PilT/PilU family type 4a pilus ATPase [Lachnospiraceae bacterium]